MNFDWVKMWCLKYQCMASFFFLFLREVFLWVGIDDIIVAFGRFRESLCIISIKVCKFCFKELHIELPLYQSKLYRILVLSIFLDQPSTDPQSIEPYISTSIQNFLDQLKDRRCNKAHCSIVSSLHLFLDHFISIFFKNKYFFSNQFRTYFGNCLS